MNLGEFFAQLSYGELSNLSMAADGAGIIKDDHQGRVVSHTQQVLKLLYSRFAHKIDYVTLKQFEGVKTYKLSQLNAVSDATVGNNADRYLIDDLTYPFPGNIVKILAVKPIDEDGLLVDEDLLINERSTVNTVKTLSYDTLYFETPVADTEFVIEYQANHPRLSVPPNLEDEIILAPILEIALALKVASRIYRSMNGADNVGKANFLDAEYEKVLTTVVWEDLLSLSQSDNNSERFSAGGWM